MRKFAIYNAGLFCYFGWHFTVQTKMALSIINQRLFDPEYVSKAISRYMLKTSDYSLLDRFDSTEFKPTLHMASLAVTVFAAPNKPDITFNLQDLIGQHNLADVLNLFERKQILNGHVFSAQSAQQSELAVYYTAAMEHFPSSHIGILVCWKRSTKESLFFDRGRVWDILWNNNLKFQNAYHPAIFLAMNQYKGPMCGFLQQVTSFVMTNMPPNTLHVMYDNIICKNWKLKSSFTPQFIALWHQVMLESAMVYLPKDTNNLAISSITYKPNLTLYMTNSDKFVCLLLILFNKPYRSRLNAILKHEPMPPILADILTRFPVLHNNEC